MFSTHVGSLETLGQEHEVQWCLPLAGLNVSGIGGIWPDETLELSI